MRNVATLAALLAVTGIAHAEAPETMSQPPVTEAPPPNIGEAGAPVAPGNAVSYAPSFFAQYTPQTALDMVRRVPGFSVDEGSDRRGFSGTAGNVLIDGARPSAKSQGVEDILGRIPAKQVVRIDLIRGATTGEAAGQAVVVNVVRTASAGAGRYEIEAEHTASGRITPRGELSYNGRVGRLEFTLGADRYIEARPLFGYRLYRDAQENLAAYSYDGTPRTFREANGNAAISAPLFGGTFNLNGSAGRWNFKTALESSRFTPASVPVDSFRLSIDERQRDREIGGDWERRFGDFNLKLIGLDTRRWYSNDEATLSRDANGAQTELIAQQRRDQSVESIGRASLGWRLSDAHRIEFGGEGALNTLDAHTDLTVDSGSGPVVIPLDAANVRVEEERYEGFLTWNWKVSPRWTLESGVTVETSTISQTGDTTASRTLTFWKPNAQVTRQLGARDQIRLRVLRDVSQLDFGDFASSATLADNSVAAGNPDLRPQAAWRAEATLDKRFGKDGAITLTFRHDWIEDAADLVPILDTSSGQFFDAPGNIGEGSLSTVRLNGTIPLGFLLNGAQLKPDLSWWTSEVTDPVTGQKRALSEFSESELNIELRQDIAAHKLAWGLVYFKRSEIHFYRVREIETYEEGPFLDFYAETTAIPGVKVRGFVNNIFDSPFKRERRFFAPDRTGAFNFEEERKRTIGRFIGIEVSGNF